MRVGINLMAWSDTVGEQELHMLPWLKQLGYDGIEIPILAPDRIDTVSLRSALDASGLSCTASTALPFGTTLLDPEASSGAKAFLRQCIEVAGNLGAEVLCGPLYAPVGQHNRPPQGKDRDACVLALQELAPIAEHHKVQLAVEPINRFETAFLNTLGDATALVQRVAHPFVGIVADTFHMNIEEKDSPASLTSAGRSLVHMHFSENDRGVIGTGQVPWPQVMAALRALPYRGWVVFETFAGHVPQLAAATAIWRPLVPSPERYAEESLEAFRSW